MKVLRFDVRTGLAVAVGLLGAGIIGANRRTLNKQASRTTRGNVIGSAVLTQIE
jgi:hypothetical protein